MKSLGRILFLLFLILLFVPKTGQVYAGDARKDVGLYATDLTIFRTVNTLSCHPQNPFMHEVPHYLMYAPDLAYADAKFIKGACWAYHNEGNTNFLGRGTTAGDKTVCSDTQKGQPGTQDATHCRPASPNHHYSVLEFPNPDYNPDPAIQDKCKSGQMEGQGVLSFCGKYLHMEGYFNMWNLSVSQGTKHEVWYVGKEGIGVGGKHVSSFRPVGTAGLNPATGQPYNVIAGIIMDDNNANIQWSCKEVDQKRQGDEARRCVIRFIGMKSVRALYGAKTYYANPLLFTDIPHGRDTRYPTFPLKKNWYDDPSVSTDDHDDDWVRCKEKYSQLFGGQYANYDEYMKAFKAYIENRKAANGDKAKMTKNVPLSAYTPEGCDYPALPTTKDETGYFYSLDAAGKKVYVNNKPTEPQQLAALVNGWNTLGITTPSITPTPTEPMPEMSADLNNDGEVNLYDYGVLLSDFGNEGNLLRGDLDNDRDVDSDDVNIWFELITGH